MNCPFCNNVLIDSYSRKEYDATCDSCPNTKFYVDRNEKLDTITIGFIHHNNEFEVDIEYDSNKTIFFQRVLTPETSVSLSLSPRWKVIISINEILSITPSNASYYFDRILKMKAFF